MMPCSKCDSWEHWDQDNACGGKEVRPPLVSWPTKTLRDEFANMAQLAIVVSNGWHLDYAKRAEEAYEMADAMMKAREKLEMEEGE